MKWLLFTFTFKNVTANPHLLFEKGNRKGQHPKLPELVG